MASWKVRLLTASYSRLDDVTIELFGKTDDGRSITARYRGFKPYFYLVEPPSGILADLRGDDIVLNVEDDIELFYNGGGVGIGDFA